MHYEHAVMYGWTRTHLQRALLLNKRDWGQWFYKKIESQTQGRICSLESIDSVPGGDDVTVFE